MPKAEIPEGVELLTVSPGLPDGVEPDRFGRLIKVDDVPALHAHWLEQLKEELLGNGVEVLAERRYEARQSYPGPMGPPWEHLHLRPKGPEQKEMYRRKARRDLEVLLASIPIEEGGDD